MSGTNVLRLQVPLVLLAAAPLLLALRFGGYHVRHAGWLYLALAAWACVQAARGRLSAPRSPSGIATFALLALTLWTTASISWADVSRHDAWVEAARTLGYAAAFVLGGSLLANARSFTRFTTLTGIGIAVLGAATALRVRLSDAPLQSFVAGRLDWPVGYAPGMAGLFLLGTLLLLGVACAGERRWEASGSGVHLVGSGLAVGGAGLCAALSLLAQSRGTLPAIAVAVVISLIAMPRRSTWLLRVAVIAGALVAIRMQLLAPFQAQFDLRQAPFTEGADAAALLTRAEAAASAAATSALVMFALLAVIGMAIVPIGSWLAAHLQGAEERLGHGLALPTTVAAVALVGALVVLSSGSDRSATRWVAQQWDGCRNPPERVNDPGSDRSYFANTGTGRCDYYRVALDSARDAPLLGLGAGNFRGAYVRERRTAEEPTVVHSLPLQLLAELGLVGALLGAVVFSCVVWAAWRFVRSGPMRDATFAGAIGALAYWTAHASIDWLWQLPSVTVPAMVLAGGLVACVSPAQGRVRGAVAAPFAAAALLGCIALVLPVTMADARLREARDPELRELDPSEALEAARAAQAFDPTWAAPAITEATLHAAAGRRADAAAAARRAVRLEPRNWSTQFRASGLIGLADTDEGRAAFLEARRLNPQLPATVDDGAGETAGRPDAPVDALQDPDA